MGHSGHLRLSHQEVASCGLLVQLRWRRISAGVECTESPATGTLGQACLRISDVWPLSCARRKSGDFKQHLAPEMHTAPSKPGLVRTSAVNACDALRRTSGGNCPILVMIDHMSKRPDLVPVGNVAEEAVGATAIG